MLMPRVIKGLEKSTAFSLSKVMERSAMARSAFCKMVYWYRMVLVYDGIGWYRMVWDGLGWYMI